MKDKRQGNDLKVAWSIFMQDGEPFRLDGKDVSLYLKNMFGRKELNDFVTTGNIIQWTFYGKDQKNTGKYSLELVINEGEKGMITTDKCDFVNLVSCSCKLQGGEDAPNVETESIELTSTLEYVSGGGEYDDTALWKELENKVDKVEGLGLSEENYTAEDKEKLAGLENYDDSGIKDELTKKANKADIVTPDWSASEGEEGYIKNRTHYKDAPIEENTYEESGLAWSDIREIYPFGYKYYKVTINGETQIIDFVGKDWPQYDFEKEEQNKLEYDLQFDNNVGLKVSFFENGGYERMIVVEYYPMDSAAPETIDVSITDYYVDFKQLDEEYIPDTIARQADVTELSEELASNWEMIEDLQNTKIDKEADDYYPQLSVGTADNLSGVDEVDSEFSFRRSGGGAIADGVARVQSIKGNSVVWNNMVDTRGYEDGAVIREGIKIQQGHKYLLQRSVANSGLYLIPVVDGSENYDMVLRAGEYAKILVSQYTDTTEARVYFESYCGASVISDLTQMFGAGNEPSTIEEYNARKPFVEDEYAYNEGEVIHMTAEGIKSVGRNIFNEEWEQGGISDVGKDDPVFTDVIKTKHIEVLGGETYYAHFMGDRLYLKGFFYDKTGDFIGSSNFDFATTSADKSFLAPQGAVSMRMRLYSASGNLLPKEAPQVCINISDTSINGNYFPYTENAEDLSIVAKYFHNGMRSAGAAHDEIRYNKQTNKWEKVVRVGEVDLGSLSYVYQPPIDGSYPHGYFLVNIAGKAKGNVNLCCAKYATKADWVSIGVRGSDEDNSLFIKDPSFTSTASFKAAMSGVMLYYELAEPIVTEIKEKDFNLDYKVWNCGTEQMVASKPSSALSADITYGFNAVGLIKQLRSMLEALSAKVANL